MSLLGERVRARRKELGLTQAQLAGSELTKGFISLVEIGRARPSIETMVLLARRLEKPISYFLEEHSTSSRKLLQAILAAAWASLKRREFTEAAEMFNQALGIAKHRNDGAAEAECSIGLGSALAGLRQFDLSRQNVLRGRELAAANGATQLLVSVSHVLGLIEYYEGNLGAAREHFLEGYRRFKEAGHPDLSLAGSLLLNIGNTYAEAGDYAEATRWYTEALKALEPTEDLYRVGMVLTKLGAAHRESGDCDMALAELGRAEHIFEVLNGLHLLAQTRNTIGITLLAQGKVDEAIAQFHNSLQMKNLVGDDSGRARTLTELARALIAKRVFEEAEQVLVEADRLTTKLQDITECARIELVRAHLYEGLGSLPNAVKHYKQAIHSFDKLGMRRDLAAACNELGELLMGQKRSSEAAPYLARALREFKPNLRRQFNQMV